MKKEDMIRRIRKATPEIDSILGNPQRRLSVNKEKFQLLADLATTLATIPYEQYSEIDKIRFQFIIDCMWWQRQKLAGEFQMTEKDKALPKPNREDVKAVYKALIND